MNLKESIEKDISTFFSLNEFAEVHKINGKSTSIIIDNERLKQRQNKEFNGVYIGELLYYVKANDIGEIPSVGASQKFDGRMMYVSSVSEDSGMYEIILSQNRGD